MCGKLNTLTDQLFKHCGGTIQTAWVDIEKSVHGCLESVLPRRQILTFVSGRPESRL